MVAPYSGAWIEIRTTRRGSSRRVAPYSGACIEIADRDINSLSLSCNEISDNRGAGIVQSRPVRNITGITITKNKIWNNGISVNVPVSDIEEDNCYTEDCKLLECLQ